MISKGIKCREVYAEVCCKCKLIAVDEFVAVMDDCLVQILQSAVDKYVAVMDDLSCADTTARTAAAAATVVVYGDGGERHF